MFAAAPMLSAYDDPLRFPPTVRSPPDALIAASAVRVMCPEAVAAVLLELNSAPLPPAPSPASESALPMLKPLRSSAPAVVVGVPPVVVTELTEIVPLPKAFAARNLQTSPCQSTLAPETLTTSAHFLCSDSISAAN